MLAKVRPHGLQYLRQDGRGGIVVEINPTHIDILRREVSGRLPRDALPHSSDAPQTN